MLWGTVGTAQALSPYAGSPVGLAAARIGVTGLIFAVVAAVAHGRALPAVLLRRGSRRYLLLGAAAMAAYQASFLTAMQQTGVAVGALLSAGSAPLFAGLLAALAGRRPTRGWLASTAVAVAGLTLLVVPGGDAQLRAVGVAAGLIAGAAFATYTWCSRCLLDAGVPRTPLLAGLFLIGAALVAPFDLTGVTGWLADPGGATVLGYLVVVATVLPYTIWIRGMATTAPAAAATLTLAEPLTATVAGMLVLDEPLTVTVTAGAALLGAGLVLTATTGRTVSRRRP
jgi:DME family drug/metabolite transporter